MASADPPAQPANPTGPRPGYTVRLPAPPELSLYLWRLSQGRAPYEGCIDRVFATDGEVVTLTGLCSLCRGPNEPHPCEGCVEAGAEVCSILSSKEWTDVMPVVAQTMAGKKACREYGNVSIDEAEMRSAREVWQAVKYEARRRRDRQRGQRQIPDGKEVARLVRAVAGPAPMEAVERSARALEDRMGILGPRMEEAKADGRRLQAELDRATLERDQEQARTKRLQSDLMGAIGRRPNDGPSE